MENKRTANRKPPAFDSSSHDSFEGMTSNGISAGAGPLNTSGLGSLAAFVAQCQPCKKFDDLPAVLKEDIWDLSLHPMTPRLVVVHYNVQTGCYHTTTPTPLQFKVCQHSRNVAKRYYSIYFKGVGAYGHPASIQINVDIDTVQLSWDPLRLRTIENKIFENVRYLELAGKGIQREEDDTENILKEIRRFKALETVTIVSPPPSSIATEKSILGNGMHWLQLAHQLEYDARCRMSCRIRTLIRSGLRSDATSTENKVPRVFLVITNADGVRQEPAEASG